jgi:hypothetical protein
LDTVQSSNIFHKAWTLRPGFQTLLRSLKTLPNFSKVAFTQSKEVQASINHFSKRKMAANLRQQLIRKSANQRSSSPWAYLTKQIYK